MTPDEARGVLGLSRGAGMNEVLAAYRKRSQFMHPDRFSGRPDGEIRFATVEFQRLTAARDLLRDVLANASASPSGENVEDHDARSEEQETPDSPATRVAITIPRNQAVAGMVILVCTPAGDNVRVRLPHSFQLSTTIRVRGRGDLLLPHGARNDLLVTLQLDPDVMPPPRAYDGELAEAGTSQGIARDGLSSEASLGVAALIVVAVILIYALIVGIPASSEANAAGMVSSIEFALEADSNAVFVSP